MVRLERLTASAADVERLQQLFERAPRYAEATTGESVSAAAAREALEALPPGKLQEDKFVFGAFTDDDVLVGCADLIRGYPSPSVAYVGLLLVDERLENRGYGTEILKQIEAIAVGWAVCIKLRLGVVQANERALRFWSRQGFQATGEVKPYAAGSVVSQIALFERKLPAPAARPGWR
ncbi:MAG: GNAT family N-acetyltransferase [Rubrivivax sp.]